MPVIFLLFLPSALCLFTLAALWFKRHRAPSDGRIALFYAIAAIYFYVEACWLCPLLNIIIPLTVLEILGKVSSLCLIPLFYIWIKKAWKEDSVPKWFYLLFLLPVLMLGSQLTLFTMMGWSNADPFIYRMLLNPRLEDVTGTGTELLLGQMYIKICYRGCNFVMAVEAGVIFILLLRNAISHYRNYEWSGTSKQLMHADIAWLILNALILIRLIAGERHLTTHWTLNSLLSVGITAALFRISCSAIVISLLESSLWKASHTGAQSKTMESLQAGFESLMNEQQAFRAKGLTIEDVSQTLLTNRTYLSKMLKDSYSCTFKDYVTAKRIEAAKEHMLQHPEAKLDEVAEAVGYSDSSHFSKRFKDSEGISPRAWLENANSSKSID